MIITLPQSNRSRDSRNRGFTFVELLVSVGIAVAFSAVIFNLFFLASRGAVSMGNYTDMHQQSRRVLELFGRDVRAANGISVTSPKTWTSPDDSKAYVVSNDGLKLTYPDFYDSTGMEVTYTYDSNEATLTRELIYSGTKTEEVLLRDVNSFQLRFYEIATSASDFSQPHNLVGPLASVNTWTKSIQLDAELKRKVVNTDNTDYIISARFMMRN